MLAEVWLRGGRGGAPFVAMKSSNRVLKWIQAVTESRSSRGGVQHGGMLVKAGCRGPAKGSYSGVVRRWREQVMIEQTGEVCFSSVFNPRPRRECGMF